MILIDEFKLGSLSELLCFGSVEPVLVSDCERLPSARTVGSSLSNDLLALDLSTRHCSKSRLYHPCISPRSRLRMLL